MPNFTFYERNPLDTLRHRYVKSKRISRRDTMKTLVKRKQK